MKGLEGRLRQIDEVLRYHPTSEPDREELRALLTQAADALGEQERALRWAVNWIGDSGIEPVALAPDVEAYERAAALSDPDTGRRERVRYIQPGDEWEAALQRLMAETGIGEWKAVEILHNIGDAVEAVRYAGEQPTPVIDRPGA